MAIVARIYLLANGRLSQTCPSTAPALQGAKSSVQNLCMICLAGRRPVRLLALRAWFVVALHEVYHLHPAIHVQHRHASAPFSK
jgi:hypothetical protein